ncbi:MAG: amidohydrolase family protein, partial [Alphaproteobacteria bacterium]|nr:amidohydrolase family protein [Alphaproteobacteria bacterium]
RDLRLVRLTDGRYHAGQVSTRAAVEAIRAAKKDGLPVTCGTAPHYFALNELAVHEYRTFAKTSPPLREEDDRRAVTEALADGTIDVIVSAHNPQGEEEKRQPFELAADGVIGLETLLPIGLDLVHGGHLKMLDLIGAMSLKPATILGLPCGRLKKGAPADLVLFDPEKPWRIEPEKFHSKAKNSAFENRPTQGRVLRTLVEGRTVFGDTSD